MNNTRAVPVLLAMVLGAALTVSAHDESPNTCPPTGGSDMLTDAIVLHPWIACVSAATDDSPSEPLQLTLSPTRQYRALIVTLLKTRRAVLAPRISLVRRSDQSILGVWTVNQFLNRGGVLTARIALPSPSTDALSLVIDTDDAGLSDPKIYHVSSPFASPEFFFAKDLTLNIRFARAGRVQIRGI